MMDARVNPVAPPQTVTGDIVTPENNKYKPYEK